MEVKLINYTPNPEKHIEYCGRICYDSRDKITDTSHIKWLKKIIKNGHLSVLEHSSATFEISGVSRALTHQLVRHRMFSFSEMSLRYCKLDPVEVLRPDSIYKREGVNPTGNIAADQYDISILKSVSSYRASIRNGVPAQDARYILPMGTLTSIILTGNFRAWLEFFPKRLDSGAQWEIREVVKIIKDKLMEIAPNIFTKGEKNE